LQSSLKSADKESSPVNLATLQPLLITLHDQIKRNLGGALQTCTALKWSSSEIPNMEKLEREIKRFDFKNAAATLQEIADTLKLSLEGENRE